MSFPVNPERNSGLADSLLLNKLDNELIFSYNVVIITSDIQ